MSSPQVIYIVAGSVLFALGFRGALLHPAPLGQIVSFNVSGAGITKHAKHRAAAERLLEYLVTPESQAWYAEVNNEFPVVAGARVSATLEAWGSFKADSLNLTRLGENNRAAVQVMDRAGWR